MCFFCFNTRMTVEMPCHLIAFVGIVDYRLRIRLLHTLICCTYLPFLGKLLTFWLKNATERSFVVLGGAVLLDDIHKTQGHRWCFGSFRFPGDRWPRSRSFVRRNHLCQVQDRERWLRQFQSYQAQESANWTLEAIRRTILIQICEG